MRGRKRHQKKAYARLKAGKTDFRTRQLATRYAKRFDWMTRSMDSLIRATRAMGISAQEAADSFRKALKDLQPMEGFSVILQRDTNMTVHKGETIEIKPMGGA